jgi:hypothetical protein
VHVPVATRTDQVRTASRLGRSSPPTRRRSHQAQAALARAGRRLRPHARSTRQRREPRANEQLVRLWAYSSLRGLSSAISLRTGVLLRADTGATLRLAALPPCRLAALPPRRLAALPRSVEAHPGTMFHPPDELTGGAGDEPSRVRSTHGIEAIDRRGRGRHDGGAASLRRSDADRRSRRDHGHRTKAAGATGLDHLGHRQGHRAGGRAPSRRARPAERGGQPGPWPGRCRRPAPGIRGRHPRLRSRPPPDRPPPRRSSWVAGAGGCWTRSRSASRSR